jgi:predicted transglutaminase-like cysteine proteinase
MRELFAWTGARWSTLNSINASVNRSIVPDTDEHIYGRKEFWAYPTTRGDCEDFALFKRRELLRAGWPASALLLTVVRRWNGDFHAVLTVETDRGDFILDNLSGTVLLWRQTGYVFVKRQATDNAGEWVSLRDQGAGATDPAVSTLNAVRNRPDN